MTAKVNKISWMFISTRFLFGLSISCLPWLNALALWNETKKYGHQTSNERSEMCMWINSLKDTRSKQKVKKNEWEWERMRKCIHKYTNTQTSHTPNRKWMSIVSDNAFLFYAYEIQTIRNAVASTLFNLQHKHTRTHIHTHTWHRVIQKSTHHILINIAFSHEFHLTYIILKAFS